MNGFAYERLDRGAKKYYGDVLRMLQSYQTVLTFQNADDKAVRGAFLAVVADHPELFWVQSGYQGSIQTRGLFRTLTLNPALVHSNPRQIAQMDQRLNAQVDRIVRGAGFLGGAFQRALWAHDYIVDHTVYDMNAPERYNAYGCLVNGRAVCAGYAAAYQLLLAKLGVAAGRVSGRRRGGMAGEGGHEWNYVRLDDGFYFVDVTWDDPTYVNTGLEVLSHEYFGLTAQDLQRTHIIGPDQWFPECLSMRYNYFNVMGLLMPVYRFETVERIVRAQLRTGRRFQIRFSSPTELQKAVQDLFERSGIFRIQGITRGVRYSVGQSGLVLTVYC